MSKYTPTIGIETHVQLKTVTKLFAGVDNDASKAAPNTLISHICVGMPGALPVLNKKALELATIAAFALNTKPQQFSKFDRKHYFYPDLPKGYQISQYDQPIIVGGHVDIEVDGQPKKIGITRAHLEEDAGKNTHPAGTDYSLVDLNRAGTPLLEIVSEPEIHSAQEAKAYVRELYLIMKYADVSDCDLYLGHMRFDVNVSLSDDPTKLGTRAEIKNLNSFRSVENAIKYEIERQTELLEKGEHVIQETRGWDEATQKTTSQRGKEEAQDYRYMPEPDVPPVIIDDSYATKIQKQLPVLPNEWRIRLKGLDLGVRELESLIEGEVEHHELSILPLIENNLQDLSVARFIANWFINVELPLFRDGRMKKIIDHEDRRKVYLELYDLSKSGKISSNSVLRILELVFDLGIVPESIEDYAEQKGFIQVSDENEIEKIVAEVLAENEKAAQDVKNGEMKAIGFLVGQVMAKSKGKANPGLAQQLIRKQLGI